MRKITLEFAAAIALTLGAILALAAPARANDIAVTGPYARASTTANATTGAAYLTLRNFGAEDDRLVGVASDAAQNIMIHGTEMKDGVASMPHMDTLPVPAGGEVVLAPGGTHLMLLGLKAPLKKGGTLKLTLMFEKAPALEVEAPIGGVAQSEPPAP